MTTLVFNLFVGLCAGLASAGFFFVKAIPLPDGDFGSIPLLVDTFAPGIFFGIALVALYSFHAKIFNAGKAILLILLSILCYVAAFWLTWLSMFVLPVPTQVYATLWGFVTTYALMRGLRSILSLPLAPKRILLTSLAGGMLGGLLILFPFSYNPKIYTYLGSIIFFVGWQTPILALIGWFLFSVLSVTGKASALPNQRAVSVVAGVSVCVLLAAAAFGLYFYDKREDGGVGQALHLVGIEKRSTTTEPSSEDLFLKLIAQDLKRPALCAKITPTAVDFNQDYVQSVCYNVVAAIAADPALCKNIRSPKVDYYRKTGFVSEESCVVGSSPSSEIPIYTYIAPAEVPEFDSFMQKLGYTEKDLSDLRASHPDYGPVGYVDLYLAIVQDETAVASREDFSSRVDRGF